MGEEEDASAPRPSTSTSQSFLTPQNTLEYTDGFTHQFDINLPYPSLSNLEGFRRIEESFQYPPSSSNPEEFRHDFTEFSTYEENARCTFSDQVDEMLFDVDDDLEGTPVVPDDSVRVEAPTSGMEFGSEKELMAYYKQFAKQDGFGVRTQRTKKDDDGRPVYITIGCARGGKFQPKGSNILKPRPTTKTDCKAKLNATLNKNEKWVVTTVQHEHNHITVKRAICSEC